MSNVFRSNRKGTDAEIINLNSVGLSLATIGKLLDCHPTTITLRLKSLNIAPADTRRSFMEDIFLSLSKSQRDWLITQLGPHISIKDFVKNLLVKSHVESSHSSSTGTNP